MRSLCDVIPNDKPVRVGGAVHRQPLYEVARDQGRLECRRAVIAMLEHDRMYLAAMKVATVEIDQWLKPESGL